MKAETVDAALVGKGLPVVARCDGAEPAGSAVVTGARSRAGSPIPGLDSPADRVRRSLRTASEIYKGVFFAPYGRAIQRELLRERDAFLLLTVSDLLGIPNPVQYYTLELYPHVLEELHEWHTRLGMPDAPEGGWRCC